jgi:hypothetical protein
MTPAPELKPIPWATNVVAFVGGFVVALVINFVLAFVNAMNSWGGGSRRGPDIVGVAVAWLITIGLFALFYRMHHWAAYGALGAYAALFFVALIVGGATGPYACFNAYGYPSPGR